MKYFSTIRKNVIMQLSGNLMKLKIFMLREITQNEKHKTNITFFLSYVDCRPGKKKKRMTM
jgi:hypothetical protein